MDLSVIIISYNTRELTLACLASVFEQTRDADFEVIVVDNASKDGSVQAVAEQFPQVRLLALEQNVGFARANNLAAKKARGQWLLLLNSDTVVLDNAADRLLAFAEQHRSDAGIFGGRTVFADGSLNRMSCWGRPRLWSTACFGLGMTALADRLPFLDPETMRGWRRDDVREVDIVSGCFLMIDRELWDRLDGFDTSFFMYGEDFDLCLRARRLGRRCLFCPQATIVHYGGASSSVKTDRTVSVLRSRRMLMSRHWSRPEASMGAALLCVHVLTRLFGYAVLSACKNGLDQQRRHWLQTWTRRREWMGATGG